MLYYKAFRYRLCFSWACALGGADLIIKSLLFAIVLSLLGMGDRVVPRLLGMGYAYVGRIKRT